LGALLVPPKEYVVLASRLLLSGDVGFSSLRSLSSSRFMDLMTRWIDDLRALELELHAVLRDRAAAPRSPWCLRICGGASPSRSQARRCYAVGRPREAAPGLEAGGTAHFDGNAVALGETIGRGATGAVRRGVYKGLHDVAVRAGTRVIQRRFNVGVCDATPERRASVLWVRPSGEMIARPKMSQNEWTPTETRGF
jgi:hypothetical protein